MDLFFVFTVDIAKLGGSEKVGWLRFGKNYPQANYFLLDDLAQRGVEDQIKLENEATRYWAASHAVYMYGHDRALTLARFLLEPRINLKKPSFMNSYMGYLPTDWINISRYNMTANGEAWRTNFPDS